MNVFLPYSDYFESIICLDKKRAMKQTLECKQLIDGLEGVGSLSWTRHPASRMYNGYLGSLVNYYNICFQHCKNFWKIKFQKLKQIERNYEVIDPPWLGYEKFHSSMRGRLLDKDISWYGKFGWIEEPIPEKVGYYWPVDKKMVLAKEVENWKNRIDKRAG